MVMYIVSRQFTFDKEAQISRQNGRAETTSLGNSYVKPDWKLFS